MLLCLSAIAGLLSLVLANHCFISEYDTSANCSTRALYSIPTDLPQTITSLDVSHNYLLDLSWPLRYGNLVYFNVSHSHISLLSYSTLVHLVNLQILDLSYNNIKYLSQIDASVIFQNTPILKQLFLISNPIRSLSYDVTIHSLSLENLYLNECDIRSLEDAATLEGMPNLKTLHLNWNPLIKIDEFVSDSLEELYLVGTQLRYIKPEVYQTLSKLRILDISLNQHLISLSRYGFANSSSLEILRAHYCSFESIQIKGLLNLSELYLKGNRIVAVYKGDFVKNSKLRKLDLSENWIKSLDIHGFFGAASLVQLDLSGNKLETLKYCLENMKHLLHLNVSKNPLLTLDGVEEVLSLREFDASQCDIIDIPFDFFSLPELEIVNLSRNGIDHLPHDISSYSLVQLDLSNNRLSKVDNNWLKHFPRLKTLRLTGNRLTEPLHWETLARLNHVNIYLLDNPWRCNCGEQQYRLFYNYIQGKGDSQYLTCHSPENVTGLSWKEACFKTETKLHKQGKQQSWIPMLIAAVSILFLATILVTLHKRAFIFRSQPTQELPVSFPSPPPSQQDPPRPARDARLPTYEEALLLPKPPTQSRKSNADTQTLSPYLGSSRSLNSRSKLTMNRSPSSHSL